MMKFYLYFKVHQICGKYIFIGIFRSNMCEWTCNMYNRLSVGLCKIILNQYSFTYILQIIIFIFTKKNSLLLTQTSPKEAAVEYTYYVCFIGSIVTQIFMLCYFGNEIIIKSNSLSMCIYNSNWTNFNLHYRKIMLVFMERLKKHSQVLVGKLFPLNLDTFTSVWYFFLLLCF